MADRRERELLLGIFLMEAWDTAGAIEEGLDRLATAEAPTEDSLATLVVFAHRLKGSAGLHGFPGVSDLAAGAERLLERAPTASVEERVRAVAFLEGLVGAPEGGLRRDQRGRRGGLGLHRGVQVRAIPRSSPRGAPRPRRVAAADDRARGDPGVAAASTTLRRFFAEGGEVLEYFLPEATEHLEAMTGALLAIEGGTRDDETLATVFRAAHTLKGAAYTVGCAPLGDATHQIEDLLGAVREHRLPFTPMVTEAMFAGTAAIKRVLQSGVAVSDEIAQALERATRDLRALSTETLHEHAVTGPAVEVSELAVSEAPELALPAFAELPAFVRPEFLARLEALPRPVPAPRPRRPVPASGCRWSGSIP